MAIDVFFSPDGMTATKYDEVLKRLEAAGAGAPKGREYHSCFGESDHMMVFDVYTNEDFGKVLIPILQDLKIDVGHPDVMPIHNIIVGK